jgi:hypothetical protein
VQLDGGDTLFLVGYGYNPETFQALIYSAGGLSPDKEHTVVRSSLPVLAKADMDLLDSDQPAIRDQPAGKCNRTLVSRYRLYRRYHRRVSSPSHRDPYADPLSAPGKYTPPSTTIVPRRFHIAVVG